MKNNIVEKTTALNIIITCIMYLFISCNPTVKTRKLSPDPITTITPVPIVTLTPTPTVTLTPIPIITPEVNIKGLFALFNANKSLDDQRIHNYILSNKNISGVTLRTWWRNIESQKDNYDFSYLDKQIQVIKKFNLKIKLIILTGAYSPPWLRDEGTNVPYITVDAKGQPFDFPIVWNSTYLKRYAKFTEAVFKHFNQNSNIAGITIGGPSGASAEMHFPKSWPMCSLDPKVAGCLSKEKWSKAWKTTIDIFNKFAKLPYGIGISKVTGNETLNWMNEILDFASSKSAKFFIQYNGLRSDMSEASDKFCYEKIKEFSNKGNTGFQFVGAFVKKGKQDLLKTSFDIAKTANTHFIEVYAIDAGHPDTKQIIDYAGTIWPKDN